MGKAKRRGTLEQRVAQAKEQRERLTNELVAFINASTGSDDPIILDRRRLALRQLNLLRQGAMILRP